MQSARWYWSRLRAMSPGEAAWRVHAKLRDVVDRFAAPMRRRPLPPGRITASGHPAGGDHGVGASWPPPERADAGFSPRWRERLISQANDVLHHRVRLLGEHATDLGPEIDWNHEYAAGRKAPMWAASRIDYRDYRVTGDCKWVWELNRHHHLVVLGRAYRVTGDRRFAEEAARQIDRWIEQCPFGVGMNWRSPLELAIRLINWVWTLELIRPAGVIDAALDARIAGAAWRHLWEISRKHSRYSSANNHLIGEAAGVYIGATYFQAFRRSARWRARSRAILVRQMQEQVFADGGHCELASGYHRFVMEFFLLAGLCGRQAGDEFPPAYWSRLEAMLDFAGAFIEGGTPAPMFGDCDDGYVLDLGGPRGDVRGLLAVGAACFGRGPSCDDRDVFGEPAFWLLDRPAALTSEVIPDSHRLLVGATRGNGGESEVDIIELLSAELGSRAFEQSGYYLLQTGDRDSDERISVTFDCGPLGYQSIAAHGHADALSFTLRAFGQDILVDPGTYDYFTHPQWRDYFRSTRAHNTATVDGLDQSEMLGPFLWGRRAEAQRLSREETDERVVVSGEHDGYCRLNDPVVHRRTLSLDRRRRELVVHDSFTSQAPHDVEFHLHVAEHCRVLRRWGGRWDVSCSRGIVELEFDERLAVRAVRGSEEPILGWVSRGYHVRTPCTTLAGRCRINGNAAFETRIRVSMPAAAAERVHEQRAADETGRVGGAHEQLVSCPSEIVTG